MNKDRLVETIRRASGVVAQERSGIAADKSLLWGDILGSTKELDAVADALAYLLGGSNTRLGRLVALYGEQGDEQARGRRRFTLVPRRTTKVNIGGGK